MSKAAQEKLNKYGIKKICERISNAEAQRTIAKDIGVDWVTMTTWINADADRIQQYARAREDMADKYAADTIAIADECEVQATYKGEEVTLDISSAAVARNRLRVDARKWYASKLAPKRYGEKLDVTSDNKAITLAPIMMPALSS